MWGRRSTPDPAPYLSCKCVSTHYYWSIPFSAVNSIFLISSHVCQIYVAEELFIHFLQLLPSTVFITISIPKGGQFLGVNSGSGSSSRSIFWLQLLDLNLVSNLSFTPILSISYLANVGEEVNSRCSSIFEL